MALSKDIRQEIATVARDITFPAFGGRLQPRDDTLLTRGGGKGLKLYDEIERDCHAYAMLTKRKMAVISRPWQVDPATPSAADKRAADIVRAQLAAMDFDHACLNLLDALLKGFAVGEVMWEVMGAEIVAKEILPKDQRRFSFDQEYQLRLLTLQDMFLGEPVPDRKFIVHSFGAKDGNPYGIGLGTRLFWPVFFKRQDITFWLTFADKFGSPTALGKYPGGSDAGDQRKLLDALSAISQDAGIIVPEGMVIELLEAARSGNADTYEKMARYMDEQISYAVLGEAATGRASGGALAAAVNQREEVRLELVQADSDLLSSTINDTLSHWITAFNVPGANPPTVWRKVAAPEDLTKRAERDEKLVGMGFRPSLQYIQETYGGEWTESAPLRTTPQAGDPAAFAAANDSDIADAYAEQLAARAVAAMDTLIDPVKQLVMRANSLTELQDGLLALYSEMDAGELAGVMTKALIAAELAGRFEVRNGE